MLSYGKQPFKMTFLEILIAWLLAQRQTTSVRAFPAGACGHNNLTNDSGTFSSWGYPTNYTAPLSPNCPEVLSTSGREWDRDCYSECSWTIKSRNGLPIRLIFNDMLFNVLKCSGNYIDVHDGSSAAAAVITSICGTGTSDPIFSTKDTLYVRLISSGKRRLSGHRFNATWTTDCFREYTDVNGGNLLSPGFPYAYPPNLDCTYLIRLSRGYTISIEINTLRLDTANCADNITAYDGGSDYFNVLGGPICGGGPQRQLNVSSGNMIMLKFRSDVVTESASTGFNITYKAQIPECATWRNLPLNGTISSPGFPEPYPVERATCTWILDSRDFLKGIELSFVDIQLGGQEDDNNDLGTNCDSTNIAMEVLVYDSDVPSPDLLLGRYCRRNIIPHNISSSGGKMTIIFKTKILRSREWTGSPLGFRATYVIKDTTETSVPEIMNVLPYGEYTLDERLDKRKTVYARTVSKELTVKIPVGKTIMSHVYVHQDGRASFSTIQNDPVVKGSTWMQPPCLKRPFESVCAYCACINIDNTTDANVFYNLHERRNSTIRSLIFEPLNDYVNKFKGTKDFGADMAFVATWSRVVRGSQTAGGERSVDNLTETATFQVAFAANEKESFAIVLYRREDSNWRKSTVDLGSTTFREEKRMNPNCQDLPVSRTGDALKVAMLPGNIGYNGVWVYKLGDNFTSSVDRICTNWHQSNRANNNLYNYRMVRFRTLPQCPCRLWKGYGESLDTSNYVLHGEKTGKSGQTLTCFRLSKAASRRYLPFGKECCYGKYTSVGEIWSKYIDIVQEAPDAGSATAFNPSEPTLFTSYLENDKLGYEACCVQSSTPDMCAKYYEVRPAGQCITQPAFQSASMCCDPYISTLDNYEYLFNGLGEFVMAVLYTSEVNFTMQARTDLAETESGQLNNATVFSAFGVREGTATVFVQLDPNTKQSLIIYGDGVDYTKRFQNDPDFLVDEANYTLQKFNNSLAVSFPSEISIVFFVRIRSLALSLKMPKKFQNQTRGLLGNFNGVKEDDFILPDGTSAGVNLTERQIFENFAPAWAVTDKTTVMMYDPGTTVSNYTNPEFLPTFFDEQPLDVKNKSEEFCGQNMACLYDYTATGDERFANDSKDFKEQTDIQIQILKNTMPVLLAPKRIHVTTGYLETITLTATDEDGDVVTFHTEDNWDGSVTVDTNSGNVQYRPNITRPVTLRFYAQDSKGLRSLSLNVEVRACSNCSGNGICDFGRIVESPSYYFHRVECVCQPGVGGQNCEKDVGGCANNPCCRTNNNCTATCQNLSPEDQRDNPIRFNCITCEQGYTKSGQVCLDVDECNINYGSCQMKCTNLEGSFQCHCDPGYRLNIDGRTCSDIDECDEGTDECDQLCRNTAGSYQCDCQQGYQYNKVSRRCVQDSTLADLCRNARCSQGCKKVNDSSPGLECFCYKGFINTTADKDICEDLNECENSLCSQNCTNFAGGFSCSCYQGYKLADDKTTCLPCEDFTYGENCQFKCRCSGHNTACHHVTGCVCEKGWRGSRCEEDINECIETPKVCSGDSVCFNSPGSFVCNCREGFSKNADGSCSDINECATNSLLNNCGSTKLCNNVPGSFFCTCIDGYYMLPNGDCVDINECTLGISKCQHLCVNSPGSSHCQCHPGYRLNVDRTSCVKVFEACDAGECEHGCTLDDEGNAVCFCDIGYSFASDGRSCIRTTTCENANCSHTCTTVDNKPVCTCPSGTMLSNNLKDCTDCPVGKYGTDCSSTCSCGLGSLGCDKKLGCVCKEGWTGDRCDNDLNECDGIAVQQMCQAQQAICANDPGSYRCLCRDGYQMGTDAVCHDINECNKYPLPCSQQCENSQGSYRCICSAGFSPDPKAKGECTDIDECSLSANNNCAQKCVNIPGSFRCVCDKANFILAPDRHSCIATSRCSRKDCPTVNGGCSNEQCFCNSGYQLLAGNNTTCQRTEIDWCSFSVCEHKCQNSADGGSFNCSCFDGFILNDDKRTCRDVTAACTRTDCPIDNGGCANNTCFCNDGYQLTSANKCLADDVNWCLGATCDHICQEKEDGTTYVCSCRDGFILNNDRRSCRPAHPGMCANAECQHLCQESPDRTSYICSCRQGSWLQNDKKTCKEMLATLVSIRLDANPTSQLGDNTSPSYLSLSDKIKRQLLVRSSNARLMIADFRIDNFRTGSLIIDLTMWVGISDDEMKAAASMLHGLASGSLTVEGKDAKVLYLSADGNEVSSDGSVCDVYQIFVLCADQEQCVVDDKQPTCRSTGQPSDTNIGLIVGLCIGIPCGCVIVVAIVCFVYKKKNRKASRNGVQSLSSAGDVSLTKMYFHGPIQTGPLYNAEHSNVYTGIEERPASAGGINLNYEDLRRSSTGAHNYEAWLPTPDYDPYIDIDDKAAENGQQPPTPHQRRNSSSKEVNQQSTTTDYQVPYSRRASSPDIFTVTK